MADGSVIIDTKLDKSGLKEGLASLGATVLSGIAAAGAGLSALGGYAVKVGSDFESAISNVAATMGTTADQIGDITAKAKDLGATTAFSATEAAEGFNILAQSGLSASEQLSTIESVLSLAAAGEMSMADAAGYVTTTMKAMSIEMDSAGHNAEYVADIYAKGATLANTSTAEFGEAMTNAASVAGAYNQSLETTGTALLLLAEKGYQGSAAGTYLGRAMADLYAPTANASSALTELGVSVYDSCGKQKDFLEVINELNAAFADMTEEEKAAYTGTIFTTAGLKAFNSIAANSSEEITALTENLIDCSGAAEQMAETKLDNLQGDLTKLSSATEGFGLSLYENMTEPLRDFVQEGTSLVNQLHSALNEGGLSALASSVGNALSQAVQKVAEYSPSFASSAIELLDSFIAGITRAAPGIVDIGIEIVNLLTGGILSLFTRIVELGAELIVSFCNGILSNIGTLISTFTNGVFRLASTLLEYTPQIIAAGVTLATALASGVLEAVPNLIDSAKDLVGSILSVISESSPMLLDAAVALVTQIAEALPDVISAIVDVVPSFIQSIVDTIISLTPQIIASGVTLLTALVSALPQIIATICLALPELVSGIAGALLSLIPMIVDAGFDLLVSLIQALPDVIYAIVQSIPLIVAGIVSALVACIPQIIACGIELLTSLVSGLSEAIIAIVAVIPQIVMSIITALIDSIPLIIQCGIDLLTSLISALPEIITTIIAAVPTIVSSIINALVSNIGLIVECGIQLFTALIKSLPTIISTIIRAVPQIVSSIVNAFANLRHQLVDAGANLLRGLADGIGNAIGGVVARAIEAAQSVVSAVKGAFGIASPSKLFRDEIGKMLMLGLAGGISGYAAEAVRAAQDVADDISDVDFDFPDPKFPKPGAGGVDYDALVADAQRTVRRSVSDTQGVISSGSSTSRQFGNSGNDPAVQVNIGEINVKTDELNQDADYDRVGRRIADSFVRKARATGSLNPV